MSDASEHLRRVLMDYTTECQDGCECSAAAARRFLDAGPAPSLSFEERQTVRRFEQAAHGCCDLCDGEGEVQARLPHVQSWTVIPCPTCFPAVER